MTCEWDQVVGNNIIIIGIWFAQICTYNVHVIHPMKASWPKRPINKLPQSTSFLKYGLQTFAHNSPFMVILIYFLII